MLTSSQTSKQPTTGSMLLRVTHSCRAGGLARLGARRSIWVPFRKTKDEKEKTKSISVDELPAATTLGKKDVGKNSSIFPEKLWKVPLSTSYIIDWKKGREVAAEKAFVSEAQELTKDVEYVLSMVPNKLLSAKMKESLYDLVKIAGGIYGRLGKLPVHPLVLNIALLRLYAIQSHQERRMQNMAAKDSTISNSFAAEVLHFFKYASDVYEKDPTIRKQDIVLNQLVENDTLHLPRHIVFLDHLTKSIVISIRGTKSISDMITDLNIDASPFLEPSRGILAHSGIAESAEALLPSVTIAINDIKRKDGGKYASYQVVTTGHSLGAGTAALLSILLSTQSHTPVTSYAFAPPPVISQPVLPKPKFPFTLFSRDAECKIYCFVHDRDIIARASHKELLNMLSSLTAVDSLKWTDFQRSAAVYRGKLSEDEMQQIAQVLQAGRTGAAVAGDAALYVPGDIFLLQPIASTVVDDSRSVPAPSSISVPGAKDDSASESGGQISSAWRQLVKKTTSGRGTGVLASNTTRDDGEDGAESSSRGASSGGNSAADEQARAASREAENERKRQDDQLQYEIVRVPSADSLFNGLFYYGDSMVHDHLLSAYRKALLKLVT